MKPRLSDYVDMAATEYLQETGSTELDAHWAAEFYQDNGVPDNYPHEGLVAFHALVQKELTLRATRAEKLDRMRQEGAGRGAKGRR
jgi:hypothetical protein